MSKNTPWIVATALVPLAFAGGWFVASSSERPASRNVRVDPLGGPTPSAHGAQGDGPSRLASANGNRSQSHQAVEASSPRHVPEAEIERLTGRVAAPNVSVERGHLSVVGTVHAEAGTPMAGVIVRATPSIWTPRAVDAAKIGRAAPPRDTFKSWVAEQAEEFAREEARTVEAISDATGRFVLEGLPEGRFNLKAYLDGWIFEKPANLRAPYSGDLELQGIEVFDVAIRVENPDGSLSAECEVEADPLDSGRDDETFTWTPEKTELRLPAGNWEFQARRRALDHPTATRTIIARSEEVKSSFGPGGQSEPVVLVLEPRTTLVGRLMFDQKPDDDRWYRVVTSPIDDGETKASVEKKLKKEPKHDDWTRDTFTFSNLEPGAWLVGVLAPDSWDDPEAEFLVLEEHTFVEGINEVEFQLEAESEQDLLIVDVTGPDKAPLAGCSFAVHVKDENGTDSDGLSSIKAHGGRYELNRRSAKGTFERAEKGGALTLFCRHKMFGDVNVPIAANATSASLAFEAIGYLEITVTGWERLEDRLSISVRRADKERRHYSPEQDDKEDGWWRYGPMQPGRYTVRMSARTQRWDWNSLGEREVDVTAGTSYMTFDLPALHEFTVHVPNGEEGNNVSLRSIGKEKRRRYNQRLEESLSAKFENVEPGEYLLRVTGQKGMMHVTVPGSDVTFVGQMPNAMRVSIDDEEGKWGSVGLESGDVIYGVDGKAFKNEQDSLALYQPGVTWMIMRNGADITLEAPTEPFGDRSSLGVDLTPTIRATKR